MPRLKTAKPPQPRPTRPAVAVITRTRNRPITLERARASVVAQRFADFVWVVVNDGGDPGPVDAVVASARSAGIRVEVVHRTGGHGVAAAANAGLAAADSEFVVLHDDDDAWDPRFLEASVAALCTVQGVRCDASMTWTRFRYERITADGIELISELDAPEAPSGVPLIEVAAGALYPIPISVVYRRRVHDAVGPYRVDLPVFEDWEFYLRLLRQGDFVVVPERLAYYSIRPDASGAYGNSIGSRVARGVTQARLRNEWLRADLAEGRAGFGSLVTLAPAVVAANRVAKKVLGVAGAVHRLRRELAVRIGR